MATPDRDLGEARAAIDRGDARGALKSLDRARKGYARALDSEGLEHVLDMAALVDASDDRIRIGRENLAYAAKQNLRQESRRRARQLGRAWTDPFPDLQAPTEHTGLVLTRGVKLWIGVGVLAGIAAIVGIVLANILVDTGPKTTVTLRLHNNTGRTVTVRGVRRRDLPEPRGRAGRGDGDEGRCEQAGPGLQARAARPGRVPAAARPRRLPGVRPARRPRGDALAGDAVPRDDRAPAARRLQRLDDL